MVCRTIIRASRTHVDQIVTKPPITTSNSAGSPQRRGRGRPPLSKEEADAVRNRLLHATAVVFGEQGYHGVSVELILQQCGVSRPTFYRYFRNVDEAIDLVLRDVNNSLIESITMAVDQAVGPLQKVEAGLMAWRKWGEETGPLLKSIFAEIHDARSPAAAHRRRVLEAVGNELNAAAIKLGRPSFDPIQIEAFVIGVEFLGYRFHFGPDGPTEDSWKRTRQSMLRLAVGLLGGPLEWAHAAQLAEVLGLDLR